jgi:tRNA (cmo5U34)-methyltransferase
VTLKNEGGTLIHYPSKPDLFEFDGDVAQVFDSMAARSIPHYAESHSLNAWLAKKWIDKQHEHKERLTLMDVGASTGGFYEALYAQYNRGIRTELPKLNLYASDISRPMLDQINMKLPRVITFEHDIKTLSNLGYIYDIINVSYVLQFLRPEQVLSAVKELRVCMPRGGLLFLSHKEKLETGFGDLFQERYISFRKDNGYSDEEIAAKTEALKGSMFPQSSRMINTMLMAAGFGQIQETSRWLQFSSLVAIAE